MSTDAPTILAHACERKRGSIHVLLRTTHGDAHFRLTPADAQVLGTELRLKAVHPCGEVRDSTAPIEKPGGGIL